MAAASLPEEIARTAACLAKGALAIKVAPAPVSAQTSICLELLMSALGRNRSLEKRGQRAVHGGGHLRLKMPNSRDRRPPDFFSTAKNHRGVIGRILRFIKCLRSPDS